MLTRLCAFQETLPCGSACLSRRRGRLLRNARPGGLPAIAAQRKPMRRPGGRICRKMSSGLTFSTNEPGTILRDRSGILSARIPRGRLLQSSIHHTCRILFCLLRTSARRRLLMNHLKLSATLFASFAFLHVTSAIARAADDQARVFITDSTSWEMRGSAGGSGGTFAAESHGGARPQTAEIIKTFGQRCPNAVINNKQDKADYVVVLDHEGGKGLLRHKNKVAVFNAVSGDSIVSHSTLSLGGSVQDACDAITKDWTEHGAAIRAAVADAAKAKLVPVSTAATVPAAQVAKVAITSSPDSADIEIDGSFVGNTPSTTELVPGEHTISVKKSGFKAWERKVKVGGGDIRINAEMEKN